MHSSFFFFIFIFFIHFSSYQDSQNLKLKIVFQTHKKVFTTNPKIKKKKMFELLMMKLSVRSEDIFSPKLPLILELKVGLMSDKISFPHFFEKVKKKSLPELHLT